MDYDSGRDDWQNSALVRGELAYRARDWRTAEAFFSAVRRDEDWNPFLSLNMARLHRAKGEKRRAVAEFESVLRQRPDASSSIQKEPRVLAEYGDLLLEVGRRHDARAAFRRAASHTRASQGLGNRASLEALKKAAWRAARIAEPDSHNSDDERTVYVSWMQLDPIKRKRVLADARLVRPDEPLP